MPKLTLDHLRTLAHSPAEEPVLYLDESDELAVWAAALAPADRIVLTREQLIDAMAADGGTPGEQWDGLDEEWSQEDVLAQMAEEAEDDAAQILAGE
ncbi:hypothetical protein [Streptomyces omiyaensis]|uniref:hypothetical protein n=1 Tax=Streptomyces omiyaensis TaxID=68247 RepID=UPI0036F89AA2